MPANFYSTTPPDDLVRFVRAFATLHRNNHPKNGFAPHKPVLLLAIIAGIDHGWVTDNHVELGSELVATFQAHWSALVPKNTWVARIVYPFRYLIRDGFWSLTKQGEVVPSGELGDPTSVGMLTSIADAGRFAADLWVLLQDRENREVLRTVLLNTYFPNYSRKILPSTTAPNLLVAETNRLLDEAQTERFRRQPASKQFQNSDTAYLRHRLFPQVINGLYEHKCAICRIEVRDDKRSIIDAAHIMPFAQFGNDDPRNGLALCKNHHCGFDAFWFGLNSEYRVVLSPSIRGVEALVPPGTKILLPLRPELAPAADAVEWHLANVLRGV